MTYSPLHGVETWILVMGATALAAYLVSEGIEDVVLHKLTHKKSAAHNTCWRNFSRYIRLRDAVATTGTLTHARCITCGVILPIEEMDAGHMIPGRTNGILFDESIVFAQCKDCNVTGGGERQMFKKIMVDRHGQAWYDLKVQARKTPTKLSDVVLVAMNERWLEEIKRLKAQFEERDN